MNASSKYFAGASLVEDTYERIHAYVNAINERMRRNVSMDTHCIFKAFLRVNCYPFRTKVLGHV